MRSLLYLLVRRCLESKLQWELPWFHATEAATVVLNKFVRFRRPWNVPSAPRSLRAPAHSFKFLDSQIPRFQDVYKILISQEPQLCPQLCLQLCCNFGHFNCMLLREWNRAQEASSQSQYPSLQTYHATACCRPAAFQQPKLMLHEI